MSFKVKINKNIVERAMRDVGVTGLHDALDYLATESKKEVPYDTHMLQNTCAVSVEPDGSEGAVSYDTLYAVKQHEELSFNHPHGRKAKYLEDPANDPDVQSAMLSLIEKAAKERL